MKKLRLPATDRLIRIAVVLTILGLLLLIAILVTVSAMAVSSFMLGSLLIAIGIILYLIAVVREIRETEAI